MNPVQNDVRWAVEENEKGGEGSVTTYFSTEEEAIEYMAFCLKDPSYGVAQLAVWKEECIVTAPVKKPRKAKKLARKAK